jgi:type I restriction enzyme M protein
MLTPPKAAARTAAGAHISYDELVARDKTSLDIFWLKDDSLADSDNLPAPGVIALEIVEDLQAALEQFKLIAADMTEGAHVA